VYLRNDPLVALDRIRKRGRPEEAGATLAFLRDIHRLHEDWLVRKSTNFPLPSPNVLIVDASLPLAELAPVYEDVAARVWRLVQNVRGKRCHLNE